MRELDIKVGFQCNNACIFCLNKDKRYYQKFPLEVLKKQIESFVEEGGKKLIISGGEPLISKYLFHLMTFAREKGVEFLEIQTNGRMLYYEEMVKKIKDFEPVSFLVSLHFPNNKLYKRYCRSDGFYQVMKGIKNLVKYNCNFTISTVIMKPNLPYLKILIKLLKKIGSKKNQYRFIDGKNIINNYKKFVPRYRECVPIIKEIIKENPDVRIFLKEFPICVLGKEFKNYLAPPMNPERLNLAIGNKIFTTREIEVSQFSFPNCKRCIYKSICEGVRKEYIQIYGIKEFKPITKRLKR